MNRFWRKIAGIIGIGALVFAQFALSAYACPDLARMAVPASMMDVPCDQMDVDVPTLCQKHCLEEKQKPSDAPATNATFTFVPLYSVRIIAESSEAQHHALGSPVHQAAPPPLTIRNCCFRI